MKRRRPKSDAWTAAPDLMRRLRIDHELDHCQDDVSIPFGGSMNFRYAPRLFTLSMLALCFTPSLALAHPGHDGAPGFLHGLAHPLTGLDHLLAMIAVGVLAAQRGGRALWALPLTFMSLMAAGGVFGMAGISLPFVETGIALSLLVFGLAIIFRPPLSTLAAMGLVGAFAVFHGYAHGTEMPGGVSGYTYAAGFVLATGFLHLVGIGLTFASARLNAVSRRHSR